jgi:hypothetical protein
MLRVLINPPLSHGRLKMRSLQAPALVNAPG